MQLTVRDLVEMPQLKISPIAGINGLGRTIEWAHTSELEDPSAWVLPNYLIMTTGLGIPKHQKKQHDYIMRLIDADLAGLMISDEMNAPDNLSKLIEIADAHDFPVLFINYHVPFIEVAKIIIEANKGKKDAVNNALVNLLYDHTKELIKEHDINALLERVSVLLNLPIYLMDPIDPTIPLFNLAPLPESILTTIKKTPLTLKEVQKIYQPSAPTLHMIPLQAQDLLLIVIDNSINHELMQNLSMLFSLCLENRKETCYQRFRLSSDFLDDILNERVSSAYIEQKLPNFKIDMEQTPCYAVITTLEADHHYLKQFFKYNVSGMALLKKGRLFLITEAPHIDTLTRLFAQLGISDPIVEIKRIHDTFQEAMLAYKNSSPEYPIQHYSNQNYATHTLPRSLEEAERIFEFNLGALYEQDQSKNTRYLHTLKAFLENDRAWEKTANQLHIHKQTLVYRIHKVEEITGRKLNSTADVVELWMALKAGEILGHIIE